MGQNVSGAGNQGPTIAELQSKIKELRKDGVTAAERQEILSLTEQISKALSGTTVKGDMVGLTISKDGEHVEDTDGNIATREQVEAQRYYTSKDNVRAEFCNTTMTKAEFQALKREVEVKKEEVEELRKAYNKVPSGLAHEAEKTAALTRYTLAADQLLKLESKYNAEEVLQRGAHKNKGVGGIVDAAKNNVENMENVLNVEKVYTNKDEMELFLEENPSMKGKVKFLNKGGQEALSNMIADANVVLSRAQTAHEEGRITDEQYEQIKAKYELRTSAHLYNSDGTINVRAVQNALVDISGSDQNFNLDEIGVTADDLLVKKKHVKSLAKTFGFGTEGEGKQRWTAFAKAALPALVGNLVMNGIFGRQSSSAHAKESANQEYWYADSSTTERVQTVIDGYNSDGSAFREIFTEVTTNPNWEKGAASVTAEAFAKATAQIPWLGTLAGPVAAGVFAFFMCHPETESAFGDATIEKALQDLNVVEGDENKLIVAQIQNMEITGNTVMDNRIKAAVLKQSRGETTQKINTEELLAAYQSLKDTKAKIQEIITTPIETTSTTETTTTTPTPDPTTTEVIGRGMAVDHALLNKRGVGIPTGFDPVTHKPSGPAQYVIAESQGELEVTGDNKKEPDTITMHDNTNTKVNSYKYRKITAKEIEQGYLDDGKKTPIKMSEIAGRTGPFYVLESVEDDKGTLKTKHAEIYSLTVVENKTTEDDNDVVISYDYKLEQFEGDSGSGRSSMRYAQRAKR